MALEMSAINGLLESLSEALKSASTAFPSDETSVLPPADGISLLDVKNDLLLSYIQNLVLLLLIRLRNARDSQMEAQNAHDDKILKTLLELRVYMERGVRPLEGKLRYQIDKVLRAAEDAERSDKTTAATKKSKTKVNGTKNHDSSASSNDDSASEDDSEDIDNEEAQETMYRPNAAALMQKVQATKPTSVSRASATGAYKPPRITPTVMPTLPSQRDRDTDGPSRRRKSNLLNEYVEEELSTAPRAQPSIGSNNTILDRGRSGMSSRDRDRDRERTEYEERNFTRLPTESKAERKKAKGRGDNKRDVYGGEDWTGLGGLGDRINRTVGGRGSSSVLQRREKRGRDTVDSPRGDGVAIGDSFEKRRKVMDDRADRKRKKR